MSMEIMKNGKMSEFVHPYLVLKMFRDIMVGLVRSVNSKSETFIEEKNSVDGLEQIFLNSVILHEIWTKTLKF